MLYAFLASQMLRNCKVSRILPRIADCAKNDRSAILRARYDYYASFNNIFICRSFYVNILYPPFFIPLIADAVNMHF